jgi:predicted phosphodiesterase
MRYAVISDIHSNLPALEAVVQALDGLHIDGYYCLGDIVGYGSWPNECCAIIAGLNPTVLRGNHDEAAVSPGKELWFTNAARACILWTRSVLSEESLALLHSLPPMHVLDDVTLCHGSVPDPDFYTTTPRESLLSFAVMRTPLCFLGHTHYSEFFRYDSLVDTMPEEIMRPDGGTIHLEVGPKYLINPGSVGQPRDGNSQAAFAVYDTNTSTVEFHRVSYNVRAAQEGIIAAGLPESMAARLSEGI